MIGRDEPSQDMLLGLQSACDDACFAVHEVVERYRGDLSEAAQSVIDGKRAHYLNRCETFAAAVLRSRPWAYERRYRSNFAQCLSEWTDIIDKPDKFTSLRELVRLWETGKRPLDRPTPLVEPALPVAALERLIRDLFNSTFMLRRFVGLWSEGRESLHDELPGDSAPLTEAAFKAAEGLRRHGMVGPFLERLTVEFPRRARDIAAVAGEPRIDVPIARVAAKNVPNASMGNAFSSNIDTLHSFEKSAPSSDNASFQGPAPAVLDEHVARDNELGYPGARTALYPGKEYIGMNEVHGELTLGELRRDEGLLWAVADDLGIRSSVLLTRVKKALAKPFYDDESRIEEIIKYVPEELRDVTVRDVLSDRDHISTIVDWSNEYLSADDVLERLLSADKRKKLSNVFEFRWPEKPTRTRVPKPARAKKAPTPARAKKASARKKAPARAKKASARTKKAPARTKKAPARAKKASARAKKAPSKAKKASPRTKKASPRAKKAPGASLVKGTNSTMVTNTTPHQFQIALSFAGEDRNHAKELAEKLRAKEVSVFYDEFQEDDLWGKNLYDYLTKIYRDKAKFCVVFASQHYAAKVWTNHERKAAQARAIKNLGEYILPLRLDDTEIPGLLDTVAFLDLRRRSMDNVVASVLKKLGIS